MKWEEIPMDTSNRIRRLRTPWGWLVESTDDVLTNLREDMRMENGYEWRSSITFVFDPFHWWKIKTKNK